MRRCRGITRNFRFCQRRGDWILFCPDHRMQPFVWIVSILGVVASLIAVFQGVPQLLERNDTGIPSLTQEVFQGDRVNYAKILEKSHLIQKDIILGHPPKNYRSRIRKVSTEVEWGEPQGGNENRPMCVADVKIEITGHILSDSAGVDKQEPAVFIELGRFVPWGNDIDLKVYCSTPGMDLPPKEITQSATEWFESTEMPGVGTYVLKIVPLDWQNSSKFVLQLYYTHHFPTAISPFHFFSVIPQDFGESQIEKYEAVVRFQKDISASSIRFLTYSHLPDGVFEMERFPPSGLGWHLGPTAKTLNLRTSTPLTNPLLVMFGFQADQMKN